MRSKYKILIASSILIMALTIPSNVGLTTSWFSDIEETHMDVSILSITITYDEEGTETILDPVSWKWRLTDGIQYHIETSANTPLFILNGSVTINGETVTGKIENPNGKTVMGDGSAIISLFSTPPPGT